MEPGLRSCVASSGKGRKCDRGERGGGDSVRYCPRKSGLLESEEQEEKVSVAGDGHRTQALLLNRCLREEGAAAPFQGLRKTVQRRRVSDLRQGKRCAHTRRPGGYRGLSWSSLVGAAGIHRDAQTICWRIVNVPNPITGRPATRRTAAGLQSSEYDASCHVGDPTGGPGGAAPVTDTSAGDGGSEDKAREPATSFSASIRRGLRPGEQAQVTAARKSRRNRSHGGTEVTAARTFRPPVSPLRPDEGRAGRMEENVCCRTLRDGGGAAAHIATGRTAAGPCGAGPATISGERLGTGWGGGALQPDSKRAGSGGRPAGPG